MTNEGGDMRHPFWLTRSSQCLLLIQLQKAPFFARWILMGMNKCAEPVILWLISRSARRVCQGPRKDMPLCHQKTRNWNRIALINTEIAVIAYSGRKTKTVARSATIELRYSNLQCARSDGGKLNLKALGLQDFQLMSHCEQNK